MSDLKKTKRIIAFIALFISVVFVLLLALTPKIAKNYINKNGAELTGRKLYVDKLKMNFFSTTLRVIDFKMYEENGTDVFIGLDTLLLNVKPLRLLKNELHVEQLLVVNSRAQILQHDTLFNFSDLLEFYASDSTAGVEDEDTEPYRLNLNHLEFKGGGFSYTDVEMEHDIAFNDLSFSIPHIYWGEKENSKADIHFSVGEDGDFTSSFDYDTESGDFTGVIDVLNLDLGMVLPYMQEYIDFSAIVGTMSLELLFSGNEYELEEFSLNGNARVDGVKIKDGQNKTVLGVDVGKAVLKEIKPMKYSVEIDSVQLDNAYVYFALIDSVSNFEKMLLPQAADPENEEAAEGTEQEIVVNRFIINNGLVDFSDQRMYEVFDYELSQITADMDTISLQDDWINLNAKMKLNKRGNLTAKVGMNPMDPMNKVSVEYVISDFQLPDVNIYSKHYMGLPILFGDMYYVGNTTIAEGQLESKNELIIRNVEMGRKTGGLYDVPIKLALFILKDINGDIVLDIPVSGDLSDPQTHVGAIVWNTVKGFMFKIVASPFKALGNLLGAEPEDLEEITLNYGDTLLLPKQKQNLDLLLELEELKPEIRIEMQYLNDKKLERTDVAAVYMQDSFYEKHDKKASGHRKAYLNYLVETSGRDSMLMQDYELLLAPEEVVDSIIQEREELRIKLVENYFTTQNDSSEIQVIKYNGNDALNVGSRPHFNIKYSLAEEGESDEKKE